MSSGEATTGSGISPDNGQKKNKNWIWLFVVLFTLAALAAGINLTYNLRQQLTPEQLAIAKNRWDGFGLADYDLIVHKDVASAGSERGIRDVINVQVRKKMVTDLQLNGRPVEQRRLWSQYDMAGWFEWIERDLQIDRQPNAPRSYCIAQFDPDDGHIIKYIRSISATGHREEFNIELKLPAEEKQP
jgi:hypothetical protein